MRSKRTRAAKWCSPGRKWPAGRIRPAAVCHPPGKRRSSARYLSRHDVPQNSDCQPRRNRLARDLRLQGTRHFDRGGVFRSRPQLAARALCRRGRLHRAAAQHRELSEHPARDQRGGNHRRRRHPSRLRLPLRKREFRRGLRGLAHHLHRSVARHPAHDGRERAGSARNGRCSACPSCPAATAFVADAETAAGGSGAHRLSRDHQGFRRGRRPRHARGAQPSEDLTPAWETARNEAQQAFGVPDVYLEKFIEQPRHIEFQVLGDQPRQRDALWASASAAFSAATRSWWKNRPRRRWIPSARQELGHKVVDALKKIGYTNAGTVEFLMDEDGSFYFIEMNARIQVEHPVTEMVTNVDLIKAQIRIAAGEKLADATGPVNFAATASSAASTPRILRPSCPQPDASPRSRCPAGPACAWIPPPMPMP